MTTSPEPQKPSESPPAQTGEQADPHSDFKLEIIFSVGYVRKRAAVSGKFEGFLVTMILLIAGIFLVAVVVDTGLRLLGVHLLGN